MSVGFLRAPRRRHTGSRGDGVRIEWLVRFYEDHALPGFAGAEFGSRVSRDTLNPHCDRVRATEHASRDPTRVLGRLNCLRITPSCGGVLIRTFSGPARGYLTSARIIVRFRTFRR